MIYRYAEILEDTFVPYLNKISRAFLIFQQDNATPHVSSNTLKWFEEKNIAIMKFPQCSPDLTPMENLWAELSRMMYFGNRIIGSREELISVIKYLCAEIAKNKKEYLLNIHRSVLRSCIDVLVDGGGETKY